MYWRFLRIEIFHDFIDDSFMMFSMSSRIVRFQPSVWKTATTAGAWAPTAVNATRAGQGTPASRPYVKTDAEPEPAWHQATAHVRKVAEAKVARSVRIQSDSVLISIPYYSSNTVTWKRALDDSGGN